jgi:hypothetical protein
LFGAQSGALKNQGKEPFIMKIAKKKQKQKTKPPKSLFQIPQLSPSALREANVRQNHEKESE